MPRRRRTDTRAYYYGIDATAKSRDAVAKLTRVRAKVAKLQEPWAEADAMVEAATQTALDALDALMQQYKDSAQYLNEPMPD